MATFEEVLDSLDPPIKHEVQHSGGKASLLLFDILLPAMVQQDLSVHQLNDPTQFPAIALLAVNELRAMGSFPALIDLPTWVEPLAS